VRLVAGGETRIARMMALQKCDHSTAVGLIGGSDQARRRFVKNRFGSDIDDPHTYDLVLNTDRLSSDAVAAIVIEGLRRRQTCS